MQLVEKHAFGRTDMQVSKLGFGSYKMSGKSGGSTVEGVRRLLGSALDNGLNVIDTAECYGQGEELLGQAVGYRRKDYYLFTKCGHAAGLDLPDWHPQQLEESIERSLRRLKTDYLDLIQLHSCSTKMLRRGEVIEVLQRAREAGKVRYIGYSGDGRAAAYAVQCGAFDALQISVNIADQEALQRILPLAQARQMGIIAKRSLANVAWQSDPASTDYCERNYRERLSTLNYPFLRSDPSQIADMALRFTLSVPEIDIVLVGGTNPLHWQHNLELMGAGPLPPQQFEAVRQRWRALTWWRRPLQGGDLGWHGCV
jgi:aryl-alcohol dehydrogenase-like predicted oxidoreductase